MATTAHIQAGIYARISKLKDGTVFGTERQVPPCERYVADLGGMVVDTYIDDDRSAWSGKPREEYERMLRDAASGRVNTFVVVQFDRFTRRSRDAQDLHDFANQHGIRLFTVGGPIDLSTAAGRKQFRDLASSAEFESDLRSERLRAKHAELRENGEWRGGLRPLGYDLEPSAVLETTRPDGTKVKRLIDCRLVVNPREAEIIRQAASRILLGGTLSAIVKEWARDGIRGSRGGLLNTQRLRQILTGPHLAGLRANNGGYVTAEWEPILDRPTWERLKATLDQPPPHPRGPQGPRVYLLASMLTCACGGPMTPHPRSPDRRGYQCDGQKGGCGKLRRTAIPIEDHVRDAVLQALADPATRTALERQATDTDAKAKATELVARRKVEQARLQQLRDALGDGAIDPQDFAHAKARIQTRIAEADAAMRAMTDTSASLLASLPETFDALREAWEGWALDQRRAVLRLAINGARLTGRLTPGTRFRPEFVVIDWKV